MLIDAQLCCHYIGRDEAFWARVQASLDKALALEGEQALYDELVTVLLEQQDVDKAIRLLTEFSEKAKSAGALAPLGMLASILDRAILPYQKQGADEQIIKDTFGDVLRWVNWYQRETGKEGLGELCWAVRAYANKLYQIGCLQYERVTSHAPVQVWKLNQGILLMACGGACADHNGMACADIADASFITGTKQTENEIHGHLIDPATGLISAEETALPHEGLTCLLRPGDAALTLHIPAGTSLEPTDVDASLAAAKRFFEQAGMPFPLCICHSWMLDPQLVNFLKPGSRILNLARRFARFSVPGEGSGSRFIFMTDTPPLELPEFAIKTSLQKAVISHLKAGGKLYDFGGAMLL